MNNVKSKKKKIFRKYTDFFPPEDTRKEICDPEQILTIHDFDSKGKLINPKAPCVVTAIDPEYTADAAKRTNFKKFNMKTDILRIREITRTKFVMYATQQMALDRAREEQHNERVYNEMKDFLMCTRKELDNIERESFNEMMKTFKNLEDLQSQRMSEELKQCEDDYQNEVMETQEVYCKFLYLLKLINYFDEMNEYPETRNHPIFSDFNMEEFHITNFQDITQAQIDQLKTFINDIIQPYLQRENHLNANIWIASYDRIHRKIFNFFRQFTQLAVLNHIFSIIYEKFVKTYNKRIEKPIFLKNREILIARTANLKATLDQNLAHFEEEQKSDKEIMKIAGIVHVLWQSIFQSEQQKSLIRQTKSKCNNQLSATLRKVEQIEAKVLELFSILDKNEPKVIKMIEVQVRAKINREKEQSRRALVKENRWKNWLKHYKKH